MANSILPTELVVPDQQTRLLQLQSKLEEYKSRIDDFTHPELQAKLGNARGVCKLHILFDLLREGRLTYTAESTSVLEIIGEEYRPDFDQAWRVINDYIATGGAYLIGGTGLPSLTEPPF